MKNNLKCAHGPVRVGLVGRERFFSPKYRDLSAGPGAHIKVGEKNLTRLPSGLHICVRPSHTKSTQQQ